MNESAEKLSRPSWFASLSELNLPLQALSSWASWSEPFGAPKGDGHSVLILPGFGAGDVSLLPLKNYLRLLGYDAASWGLGQNTGRVERLVELAGEILDDQVSQRGQPVSLVGWSLGGVVARELARTRPKDVRQVITLGSPIKGGPKYTAVGEFVRHLYPDFDELELEIERRNRDGISVPVTSIYSKLDGIVPWQASIDDYNPMADNIEVVSTHIGLGVHPRVFRIVADKLAVSIESDE